MFKSKNKIAKQYGEIRLGVSTALKHSRAIMEATSARVAVDEFMRVIQGLSIDAVSHSDLATAAYVRVMDKQTIRVRETSAKLREEIANGKVMPTATPIMRDGFHG